MFTKTRKRHSTKESMSSTMAEHVRYNEIFAYFFAVLCKQQHKMTLQNCHITTVNCLADLSKCTQRFVNSSTHITANS